MVKTRGGLRGLGVALALMLVAASCGDDDDTNTAAQTSGSDASSASAPPVGPPGAPGALAGVKGTTPLVDLPDDFKASLDDQGIDNNDTYNYGAESYDAVIVISLAALISETDGIGLAEEINQITRGGSKCTSYEACAELVEGGTTDIDYDGASGPMEFSGNGEPTVGSYGVLKFGDDNRIDASATEYRTAQAPPEADVDNVPVEGSRDGDGTLTIGTLLPETGSLSYLGPPMRSGVKLGAETVNAAGGVLGKPIVIVEGDSSDAQNPTVAAQTVDRLLGQNVDAVVGPASSSVTLNVIDKITGAGVIMFSSGATSKTLSTFDDEGLFFRNAPSDILQGQVLGEVLADDGVATIGLLVLNDAYGTGLQEDLTESFEASGGEVVEAIVYDPKAQTFDTEVDRIKAANPDAIVLISFEEASRLLATLIEKGIGPDEKPIYGVDGWMGNKTGQDFEAGK